MRFENKKYLLIWLIYFFILVAIALWVRDIPNQPDVFNTTLDKLIRTSSMGDPASFATAAIDIAENGWISNENAWILNLWPPGFILLEAVIIKIFGYEANTIFILQIFASLLLSVVLILLYKLFSFYMKSSLAFMLPLSILIFPVSRVFLLEPTGITLGESFSISFFLICVLLTLHSQRKATIRYAVYAGISLTLAAYFRSQYEIIMLALTACAIFFLVFVRLPYTIKNIDTKHMLLCIKTIAILLFVAHLTSLPWRIYHWIHQGKPSWVFTSGVIAQNSVMTSKYLESVHGGFVVAGGGNLVCQLEPDSCGDIKNAKKLFLKTFLKHPYAWLSYKLQLIGGYWFSSVENWTVVRVKPSVLDKLANGLFIITIIAAITILFTKKLRSHHSWLLLVWFNSSLIMAYTLIFTLAHFEVRYFYFPKIVGVVMCLIVATLYIRSFSGTGNSINKEVNLD